MPIQNVILAQHVHVPLEEWGHGCTCITLPTIYAPTDGATLALHFLTLSRSTGHASSETYSWKLFDQDSLIG